MEVIQKKRVSDSVIIAKTKLLQFTNNVSNIVSLLGFSSILFPIPENLKYGVYVFILCCLIYSSNYGNDTAKKIIDERKKKGDLFSKDFSDGSILAKLSLEEYNSLKNK